MKELLSRFAEIDTDKDGLVNVQEFAQYLNLPLTHNVKRIFSLYDRVSSHFACGFCNLALVLSTGNKIVSRCKGVSEGFICREHSKFI